MGLIKKYIVDPFLEGFREDQDNKKKNKNKTAITQDDTNLNNFNQVIVKESQKNFDKFCLEKGFNLTDIEKTVFILGINKANDIVAKSNTTFNLRIPRLNILKTQKLECFKNDDKKNKNNWYINFDTWKSCSDPNKSQRQNWSTGTINVNKNNEINNINFTIWVKNMGYTFDISSKEGTLVLKSLIELDPPKKEKTIYDIRIKRKPKRHITPRERSKEEIEKTTPASLTYSQPIIEKYYSDYDLKPFISMDREINTSWTKGLDLFADMMLVPKKMMTRFTDSLLPGDIYMLYWIDRYGFYSTIPGYFEYEFGVNFLKEAKFLEKNKFLTADMEVTEKGKNAIKKHYSVIDNKR